jgi:hypothetical protein
MMKRHYDRQPLWNRNKRRPTYSESQSQLERLRVLSQWLMIIPFVMLILFSCGQIGILTSRKIAEANTQSNMEADYGPWSYVLIHSVKPEIIEEIVRDRPPDEGEGGSIPYRSENEGVWINPPTNPTIIVDILPSNTVPPASPDSYPSTPSNTPNQGRPPTQTPTATATYESPIPSTSTVSPSTEPTIKTPASTFTVPPPPPITFTPTPTKTQKTPSGDNVTFWLTSAGSGAPFKLITTQPNGTAKHGNVFLTFKSDPLPETTSLSSGNTKVYFYATNSLDQSMPVGIFIKPTYGFPLGGGNVSIPANSTTPTLFSLNISTMGYNFPQSASLELTFSTGIQVSIYFDGEWNDSRLIVPPMTQ